MKLLTITEVSRMLRINVGTSRNRLSRGEDMPPSLQVGRRRLFPEEALNNWLKEKLSKDVPPRIQDKSNINRNIIVEGAKSDED